MPVDGVTPVVAGTAIGMAGGAALVGFGYGVYCEIKKIRARNRAAADRLAENAEFSAHLLANPVSDLQLPNMASAQGTQPSAKQLMQAVWEAHGKDRVLRLGAAIVLTFSATQLQALELKPAAQLIHQQIAEHYPDADVSFINCKAAAVELGKQGGLKNIVEGI